MSVDRLQVNPGRFPFSPKFRKVRLEIKRKGQIERAISVRSDRNISDQLWRRSTLLLTGPTSRTGISFSMWQICCSQYCTLLTRTIWRELVNLFTNHSFVTIEQCSYRFYWCTLAQQSDFIMIWWISGPFLWWFQLYFGFGCVFIWRESNLRWPGSCLWNRIFNVPLGTWISVFGWMESVPWIPFCLRVVGGVVEGFIS